MSTIQENLRATLLSLKQISDRLKSLVTNSSTKTDVSNAKGDIITAIGNIPEPDLSSLATEANATSNKNAVIAAIPSVANIQNGLATSNDVTTVSNKIGTFTGLNTVASKLSDIQTSIEGVSVSDLKLQLFFGIEGTFEAEAVGGETTDNPVIDECKTRYAEVFEDLLPSDFVMPNSVTIDGTTYTGTVNS